MIHYVVGFAFDRHYELVLLIEKRRPAWQAGRLNGVGGKCESGETASESMAREFCEETGVVISPDNWRRFCTLTAADGRWRVVFFATDVSGIDPQQTEDESPIWVPFDKLSSKVIDNLHWLIPMALAQSPVVANVVED